MVKTRERAGARPSPKSKAASSDDRRVWARVGPWLGRNQSGLLVMCLGLVTAFFSLTRHGLWGDEVWSTSWSQQQPLQETFSRFLTPPDLPLNFILVQVSTTFGQSEFWVRLPSALLGAGTVLVLFLLGRRLYGTATGVAAAVILAVAPYHVWYAQDARPYAPLAFYSLLSLSFFWALIERPSAGAATGFAIATTLNLYNHLFGVFPLITEFAAAIVWGVVSWAWPRHSEPAERQARRRAVERSLLVVGAATGASLILSLPLLRGFVQYIQNSGPSEIPTAPFHLTFTFVVDLFGELGSGKWWPFWLLGLLFLVGIGVDLSRRQWFAGLAVAWLSLPLLVVWLDAPRHDVNPRYFLFLQPVFLLPVARGLIAVSSSARTALSRLLSVRGAPDRIGAALSTVLVAALATAMFPPTWKSYTVERTNDWSAICSYLHAHAEPGAVVSGDLWAPGALYWCFRQRTTDRPDVVVAPPGTTRTGVHAWYVRIDALGSGQEPVDLRQYAAVPHGAWAERGLDPATSYDDRLPYPQSEVPGTLYHR